MAWSGCGSGGPPMQCLICRNHVSQEVAVEGILETQLRVIYVVSKLLEIPQHFTTRLLAEYGNPGEWTTFCTQCHTLVTQGEELFKEIQQLEKKHQKVKDTVRLAMQVKPELDDSDSDVELGGAATEIREFLETIEAVTFDKSDLNVPAQLSPATNSLDIHPATPSPSIGNTKTSPSATRKSKRLRISNPNNQQDQLRVIDKDEEHSSDSDSDVYSPPPLTQDSDAPSDSDEEFEPRPPPKKKPCADATASASPPIKELKRRKKTPLLTFQEILQLHKDFTEKLLPPSKTASKIELVERRRQIDRHSVGNLVEANYIKQFQCQTCPQVFSKYQDWVRHTHFEGCDLNPSHTVKKFGAPVVMNKIKCEECGKLVANKRYLEDHHRLRHSPQDIRVCRGCNQNFAFIHEYQKHYRESNPDSSDCVKFALKCAECPNAVRNSEEALALHRTLLHINPPPDPYQCLQCVKTFSSKSSLRGHVINCHTPKDQRPFKCDRCSASCVSASTLKVHLRDVHLSKEEGAPTYPCSECGKAFTVQVQLMRHKKLHNPDDPYLCNVCGKTFKIKQQLKDHSRSHVPGGNRKRYEKWYAEKKRNQKEAKEKGV